MILIAHILIAISSLFYAGYTLYRPSQAKLHASYALIAMTIASGTYLVLSMQASMLHACVSGLAFVATSAVFVALARQRLAHVKDIS